MLWELSKQIEGHTICALADGAAWPVQVRANKCIILVFWCGVARELYSKKAVCHS